MEEFLDFKLCYVDDDSEYTGGDLTLYFTELNDVQNNGVMIGMMHHMNIMLEYHMSMIITNLNRVLKTVEVYILE